MSPNIRLEHVRIAPVQVPDGARHHDDIARRREVGQDESPVCFGAMISRSDTIRSSLKLRQAGVGGLNHRLRLKTQHESPASFYNVMVKEAGDSCCVFNLR